MMAIDGNSMQFPDPDKDPPPGQELLMFVQSVHVSPASVHVVIGTNHAEPLIAVIKVAEAKRLGEDLLAAVEFVTHAHRRRDEA